MSACNLSPIVSGSPLRGGVSVGHISASGQAKNVLHKLLFLLPCSLFPFTTPLTPPSPLYLPLSYCSPPAIRRPCLYFLWLWLCCRLFILHFCFHFLPRNFALICDRDPFPSPSSSWAPARHWHWWHCNCFVRVRLFTFCSHCLQWECNAVFAHMLIYEFSVDILAMRVKRICGVKKTRTNW